jgi:hypothetical protein
MTVIANIVANTDVNINCVLAVILLKKLDMARPTRKPPQYSVDSKACIPKSIPPITMSVFPKNDTGLPESISSNAYR